MEKFHSKWKLKMRREKPNEPGRNDFVSKFVVRAIEKSSKRIIRYWYSPKSPITFPCSFLFLHSTFPLLLDCWLEFFVSLSHDLYTFFCINVFERIRRYLILSYLFESQILDLNRKKNCKHNSNWIHQVFVPPVDKMKISWAAKKGGRYRLK